MAIPEELFRRTVAAAYDLQRHGRLATFPDWLVRVLAQAIACDSAALVRVDPARQDFSIASWPGAQFAHIDHVQVAKLHAQDHPFVTQCRKSRSARAWRLAELDERGQFARTELHAKVYRFLGIEHQLLMLVASPDAHWRAVALNRRDADFSEEERLALESLWPHIMLAERRLRRLAGPRDAGSIDASPKAGSGVIVITGAGAVTVCSEQARLWLAEYFDAVFLARGVTLPEALRRWIAERLERERSGRRIRVVRRDPLIVARGERSLVIELIVDHGKDTHLVTLEEVTLNAPAPTLEALGLTPREAEVLSWVAQGKTNREVGMILGSSGRTVQKHLEHIFEKIGVESRTAAILRAWQASRHAALGDAGVTRPSNPR